MVRAIEAPFETIPASELEGLSEEVRRDIESYCSQLLRYRRGELDEELFRSLRLARGIYGQRQPGVQMVRVKIPFGELTAAQLRLLADLVETYSTGMGHITTRQDIQFYFVKLDDTPEIMVRLARAGLTTAEACGNSARNVAACPLAGACPEEAFDVTPYAAAAARHFIRGGLSRYFPRKFKVAFSGCQRDCGQGAINDIGAVAALREEGGKLRRGFRILAGGGLGATPNEAREIEPFVPEEDLIPYCQAIGLMFTHHGERKNRKKARMKFILRKVGLEAFRELIRKEFGEIKRSCQAQFLNARAWEEERGWLDHKVAIRDRGRDRGPRPSGQDGFAARGSLPAVVLGLSPGFADWRLHNVRGPLPNGRFAAFLRVPLGDLTAAQFRALADLCERYADGALRTTNTQNVLLRHIRGEDLARLHRDLVALGLGEAGTGDTRDVLACPGTDTCQLGITSSKGVARALADRIAATWKDAGEDVRRASIKVSGCMNSCGHHHVATVGFFGATRIVDGNQMPYYQLLVGGGIDARGARFGRPVATVPAKRAPEVLDALVSLYRERRGEGEDFQTFLERADLSELKERVERAAQLGEGEARRDAFIDWERDRAFSTAEMGTGECMS
ncbi:MAG: nitrite/sulfite reductase [Nitrospinota bacterium]